MGQGVQSGVYGNFTREPDKRRVDGDQRKAYDIKSLWSLNHEIIDLDARGFKGVDIAKILHISPQTVSNTLNSTLGSEKKAELREIRDGETRVRMEQIRVLTDKAIGVYNEILDNETNEASLKDRRETADNVLLELSGLRVPTKVQAMTASYTMSHEDFEEFKKRGIAVSREAGLVVSDEEAAENGPEPKAVGQ